MNIEQTIKAAQIMTAWAHGNKVEVKGLLPDSVWIPASEPCWNWQDTVYRIKPTATLRPWSPDEVPLGAWMRNKSVQCDRWIIVHLQYSSRNREEWLDKYEHSTDGGVTWKPCGVVEDKL